MVVRQKATSGILDEFQADQKNASLLQANSFMRWGSALPTWVGCGSQVSTKTELRTRGLIFLEDCMLFCRSLFRNVKKTLWKYQRLWLIIIVFFDKIYIYNFKIVFLFLGSNRYFYHVENPPSAARNLLCFYSSELPIRIDGFVFMTSPPECFIGCFSV
jgi:hypothetical protein